MIAIVRYEDIDDGGRSVPALEGGEILDEHPVYLVIHTEAGTVKIPHRSVIRIDEVRN